jgi:hypothetical protein
MSGARRRPSDFSFFFSTLRGRQDRAPSNEEPGNRGPCPGSGAIRAGRRWTHWTRTRPAPNQVRSDSPSTFFDHIRRGPADGRPDADDGRHVSAAGMTPLPPPGGTAIHRRCRYVQCNQFQERPGRGAGRHAGMGRGEADRRRGRRGVEGRHVTQGVVAKAARATTSRDRPDGHATSSTSCAPPSSSLSFISHLPPSSQRSPPASGVASSRRGVGSGPMVSPETGPRSAQSARGKLAGLGRSRDACGC